MILKNSLLKDDTNYIYREIGSLKFKLKINTTNDNSEG